MTFITIRQASDNKSPREQPGFLGKKDHGRFIAVFRPRSRN